MKLRYTFKNWIRNMENVWVCGDILTLDIDYVGDKLHAVYSK